MAPPPLIRKLLYVLFAVCPLLFFTDLTRNPYYTQIFLLNVLVCSVWLVWAVQAWRAGEWVWISTDLDLPLAALLGISMLSWAFSYYHHPAFGPAIYSEGSRGAIFLIVNTVLVFGAAIRGQDRGMIRRLLWITYAVATAASIYGIAQFFGMEWIWPRNLNPYGNRPVSTFGNPNFMSSYLVLVIPVVFADYVFCVTGAPRFLLGVACLSSIAASIATLTRSSWLGIGVAAVILGCHPIWRSPGFAARRRAALVFLGVVLLTVLLWPKSGSDRLGSALISRLGEIHQTREGVYAPVSQRYLIWLSAWSMVEQHPIIGKGWGCFELFYPFFQGRYLFNKDFQGLRTHANNAHNEILEYWSQVGTVGLGIMFWLWIVFFRLGFSINRRLDDDGWKMLHLGFLGGVAGFLADNLLNVSAHFAVPAFGLWWWVGTVIAMDPGAARRSDPMPLTSCYRAILGIAMVVLCCFSLRAYAMWQGEIHFFTGFKLSKGGVELGLAQQELEAAHSWHRFEVNNNYELANVYARTAQPEKAMAMYEEALKANAGYDEIYFNRATIQMQSGKPDQAIADYRRTLAINPLSHDAYNALANLYLKDGEHYADAVEELYRQAVALYPGDKDFWNNLGYVYTQRQKWQEASDAYRKALMLDPQFELARRNLAVVERNLKVPRSISGR